MMLRTLDLLSALPRLVCFTDVGFSVTVILGLLSFCPRLISFFFYYCIWHEESVLGFSPPEFLCI